MAQVFPTTPKSIYDTLTGDSQFMSCIGTYKFDGSTNTIDAISIVTPNADLPGLIATNGLECIIHDSTAVTRKPYITSDTDFIVPWKVFLIVWPGSSGSDLMDATYRILEIYPMAKSYETMMVNNSVGALAQTQIVIPSDRLQTNS
jgi:hypothetical protein